MSRRPRRQRQRHSRDDEGNALAEFVFLAVLLMVPLLYVLMTVFQVQAAAFGATEAARQAGRAFALSDSVEAGRLGAASAAALAMQDQGVRDSGPPEITCAQDCLTPGSAATAAVRYRVPLRFLGTLFSRSAAPAIPVTAVHTQIVDAFQQAPTGQAP